MKELYTEIEIYASSDMVWDVMTDFEAYPEWNPFVRELKGDVEVGKRVEAVLQLPNQKEMSFKPRIIKFVPRRELRWHGVLGIQGLFDGEHIFELHPCEPRKVRFVQREVFKGLLAPLILKKVERDTRTGFEQMNKALKDRCET